MNTWHLTSFDLFSLNMTIKGAWIYRHTPSFSTMQKALAELQAHYPILGARYVESQKSMVWNPDSTEPLPFTTVSMEDRSIADLIGNQAVWSLVKPYNIKAFKSGQAAPFSAVLAQLRDGAILYVQCAHAIMDGTTFYRLVGQWASVCKGEPIEPMTMDQSLIPAPDSLTKEQTLSQVQQKGWLTMKGKQLIKMLWNLFRNNMIKSTYTIEVLQEEISRIKENYQAGTNAILTAIAAQALSTRLKHDKDLKYLFVADLRDRIDGIDSSFFGNISQPVMLNEQISSNLSEGQLAELIDASLKQALSTGQAQDNVLLSQCASHYGLPYFYFDPSDMNCSNPGTIYINNQLKFKACLLDWGCGLPEYVFPNELTDMVKFWQPVSDGPIQIIFGGLAGRIMSRS